MCSTTMYYPSQFVFQEENVVSPNTTFLNPIGSHRFSLLTSIKTRTLASLHFALWNISILSYCFCELLMFGGQDGGTLDGSGCRRSKYAWGFPLHCGQGLPKRVFPVSSHLLHRKFLPICFLHNCFGATCQPRDISRPKTVRDN